MIHSLFTVNSSGDVFLEKHWKSVISRSIVDYFFDAQVNLSAKLVSCFLLLLLFLQNKATNPIDIPPVIATPHHYLISIYRYVMIKWWHAYFILVVLFRANIFFVAVCMTEVPPLFVIEFLHRVVDTIEDYFSECSETVIKDNYVVVYEVSFRLSCFNHKYQVSSIGFGWDVGQWVPLGHRGKHSEGADQASQYVAGCRQLR